jgi:hypothetical protein
LLIPFKCNYLFKFHKVFIKKQVKDDEDEEEEKITFISQVNLFSNLMLYYMLVNWNHKPFPLPFASESRRLTTSNMNKASSHDIIYKCIPFHFFYIYILLSILKKSVWRWFVCKEERKFISVWKYRGSKSMLSGFYCTFTCKNVSEYWTFSLSLVFILWWIYKHIFICEERERAFYTP